MMIDCGSSSSGESLMVIISDEADVFSDETIDKPKTTTFQQPLEKTPKILWSVDLDIYPMPYGLAVFGYGLLVS